MINKVEFEIKPSLHEKIIKVLHKYGDYEIGGIIIGYQNGRNRFVITDFTVADDINNFNIASFIREPMKSLKRLNEMFTNKGYNYLGEWHSHPRFSLAPSQGDIETMKKIITDPDYGVDFSLLIITKLINGQLEMSGFLFHKCIKYYVEANLTYNSSTTTSTKRIDLFG